MNELILKLVSEARKYAWANETHWSAGPERERLFEEEFAELIVNECAAYLNVAMEVHNQQEQDLMDLAARKIKQHFYGVKE
jgi:hypothetical protein